MRFSTAASCLAAEPPAPEVKPASAPRFENEIAAFEAYDHKNAPPRDPILFVGSSTIRLWQTADAFPDLPVINRGFGGSTTDDVNHFADRIVFKYKPRLIVFYAATTISPPAAPPIASSTTSKLFSRACTTHSEHADYLSRD